jgi:acyl-CoA thioesterase
MSWTGSAERGDAGDLLADIAPVRGDAPGAWRIELPRAWDFLMPSGGVLMAASLRAAAVELEAPGLRLVSASTVFATPLRHGAIDAAVTVLRKGGAAAQVRIALRNAGSDEPGLETIATFARDREGPDVLGAAFPDVAMPADCDDLIDDAPGNAHRKLAFFSNFECRLARGDRFWLPGWQAGPARYARWFRYKVPPRDADGRLDRLAHAPIADTMPPALAQALGPSPYRFYAPSLDLTVHVVDDTDRDWLLVSAYLRRARAGYATAEVEVWDDARRLLAYGTQTMYLKTIAGTPPSGVIAPR